MAILLINILGKSKTSEDKISYTDFIAALEAGKVIVLDKPAVLAQAKSWGLSLYGFE